MTSQSHKLLLSSLSSHYRSKAEHRQELRHIVEGSSPLSLRVIDWFVTHHARANNIVYWIDDSTPNKEIVEKFPTHGGQNLRKFNLYLEYRAQLQSYTKMYFDPFRRYERLTFVLETTDPIQTIETTVGQLNFFRWALQNKVIDYITNHLADIEDNMSHFQTTSKKEDKTQKRKVATCAPLNVISHNQCFVHFD
jgi:hypothetical protein